MSLETVYIYFLFTKKVGNPASHFIVYQEAADSPGAWAQYRGLLGRWSTTPGSAKSQASCVKTHSGGTQGTLGAQKQPSKEAHIQFLTPTYPA